MRRCNLLTISNKNNHKLQEIVRRTIPRMIDIELQLEPDLDVIAADPTQLEQVIMNLAVNARDAMPDGGMLTLGTENVVLDDAYCRMHPGTFPGDYVMLRVSDNGMGMGKDTLLRIFEPFFTTKEPGKGTGLGLAMVYGIVKSHGGEITCCSEPAKGTTFKIYLPAVKRGHLSQKESRGGVETRGGTETILLVDDEDAIRDLGILMLTQCGYAVLTAENGEKALETYREKKEHVSLVILDLNMPGMGGKKCLDEILRINPSEKVVIASGYGVGGTTDSASALGAVGYVSKPFTLKTLLSAVRQALDQQCGYAE